MHAQFRPFPNGRWFCQFHDGREIFREQRCTKPSVVNPFAIIVMKEIEVDISMARSKSLDEFKDEGFDYVVTVCSDAEDICPFFPGKEHIHHSFSDPSALSGDEDEILSGFRASRDEIVEWVNKTFKE